MTINVNLFACVKCFTARERRSFTGQSVQYKLNIFRPIPALSSEETDKNNNHSSFFHLHDNLVGNM